MPAKPSPKVVRNVLRIVALGAVVSLLGSLRTVEVDIGTAVTAVHPRSGAARTAEAVHYDDAGLELLAVHRVVDDRLDGGASPAHLHLWALVVETLPTPARQQIRQLNVVTDGPARTLAMVHRSTTERDAWILSIDPAESDEVMERTLVHELAHLYTLGADDLTSSRTNCRGELLEIGCARSGSLLAGYAERFWAGRPEPAPGHASEFVTEYAMESAHEDLAETFLFWVYDEQPASAVIAAKYDWFEGHEVFVAARAEIRARLG
jgi:hypothetical protein